jgi:hypothetical protein
MEYSTGGPEEAMANAVIGGPDEIGGILVQK